MADRGLIRLVLDDWNHWTNPLPEFRVGYPRELTERIMRVATGKEVVAITGVRRCGKSTILYQMMRALLDRGQPSRSILFVNLEDHRLMSEMALDILDDLVAVWRQSIWPTGPGWILLDEVQEVPHWERWVRSIQDRQPELRIAVTGSNTGLMSGELATLLTGRTLTFHAEPLNYREYLRFGGIEVPVDLTPELAFFEHRHRQDELLYHLEEYLTIGGFPEVVCAGSSERRLTLLQQYFSDILMKDVAVRHQVREARALMDLARLLMKHVASRVSAGKMAQTLGVSRSWVLRMMDLLEQSLLLRFCRHFSFSMAQSMSIQKPRKVYATDLGLRNAVAPSLTPDRGHLAENVLHQHLCSLGAFPTFWSGQREVDFVVGLPTLAAVDLTWTDEIPDREVAGLLEFSTVHGAENTTLVTRTTWKEAHPPTVPQFLPLWAVLLGDSWMQYGRPD